MMEWQPPESKFKRVSLKEHVLTDHGVTLNLINQPSHNWGFISGIILKSMLGVGTKKVVLDEYLGSEFLDTGLGYRAIPQSNFFWVQDP